VQSDVLSSDCCRLDKSVRRSSSPLSSALFILVTLTCFAATRCGGRSNLRIGKAASGGQSNSGGEAAAGNGAAGNGATAGNGGAAGNGATAGVGGVGGGGGAAGAGPPCTTDAQCDDAVACTVDTCTASGCDHALDDAKCEDGVACTIGSCSFGGCLQAPDHTACDDGLLCTADLCNLAIGCTHQPSNAGCNDSFPCTIDSCDAATDSCVHDPCDSQCDDAIFCNGVERCDAAFGCVLGPAACGLGIACATSNCGEANDSCSHNFPSGCLAPDVHLLVTDNAGNLLDVAPYAASTTLISATTGSVHFDIAVLGGRWFAIDPFALLELAPWTNQVIANIGANISANSLSAGPGGLLYAANSNVYSIDPDTGATFFLGSLPPGHSSSGDIAFIGDRMFVSTNSPCGGALVEFDVMTGMAVVIGGDGLGCVYGLATVGSELFIVNCDGKIGTFDPSSGVARIFSTTSALAYGADLLPVAP